jgi:hypothetical protein
MGGDDGRSQTSDSFNEEEEDSIASARDEEIKRLREENALLKKKLRKVAKAPPTPTPTPNAPDDAWLFTACFSCGFFGVGLLAEAVVLALRKFQAPPKVLQFNQWCASFVQREFYVSFHCFVCYHFIPVLAKAAKSPAVGALGNLYALMFGLVVSGACGPDFALVVVLLRGSANSYHAAIIPPAQSYDVLWILLGLSAMEWVGIPVGRRTAPLTSITLLVCAALFVVAWVAFLSLVLWNAEHPPIEFVPPHTLDATNFVKALNETWETTISTLSRASVPSTFSWR